MKERPYPGHPLPCGLLSVVVPTGDRKTDTSTTGFSVGVSPAIIHLLWMLQFCQQCISLFLRNDWYDTANHNTHIMQELYKQLDHRFVLSTMNMWSSILTQQFSFYKPLSLFLFVHTCACIHVCVHVPMYACTRMCMQIYMVCMMCMHLYTCIHVTEYVK